MLNFSSSLRSHPKVTLPSVDNGWLINDTIIKDPPKSITTRRIDKVGSTQMVTDMIEDNGSRICGNIMKFPRGVNPAAEYTLPVDLIKSSGVGSTSTIRDNSNNPPTFRSDPGYRFHSQYGRGSGGYSARRIMMYSGAFRPPIYTQEQLLPLSRQPRIRTSCVTHPEMINYSASPLENNLDLQKNIKPVVLQAPIDPTLKYIIEKNQKQHNIEDFIQDKLLAQDVTSGVRPRDITLKENLKCFGTTKIDPTTAYANTRPCSEGITRDTMLYVFQKPGMNYVRDVLLKSHVTPNISGISKEGESKISNNYTLTYPRAIKDIVCAPRMSALLTTDEPDNINNFIKPEVLNAHDVMGMPQLDNIVAYNILDKNILDTAKYINDDIIHNTVDAGYGGSHYTSNYIDDMTDYGQIKVNNDMLYVPAYSQKIGNGERDVYVHNNNPGRNIDIVQYETNSAICKNVSDDYLNTNRRVKLLPKISPNDGFENVGCKPSLINNMDSCSIQHQINNGQFKNRVKRVHFEREPIIAP